MCFVIGVCAKNVFNYLQGSIKMKKTFENVEIEIVEFNGEFSTINTNMDSDEWDVVIY